MTAVYVDVFNRCPVNLFCILALAQNPGTADIRTKSNKKKANKI